jgi:hypothetical protein
MTEASVTRRADRSQIERFVNALFRYADPDTVVSLRAFRDGASGSPFAINTQAIGHDLSGLIDVAYRLATRCANASDPIVFCPPVATFVANAKDATEASIGNGMALSIECDQRPAEARSGLEALLGPATVVVASGGEWPNPETGELEPKLHLHWRLSEPTRDAAEHALLKRARALATRLVGGDD